MKQNMYTIFDANSEFIFGFLFSIIITCGIGCAFINYMVNYYYDIDSVSSLRARATLSEPVSHSIPAFLKVIFPHSMHELMNSSSNNSTQNITSLSNYYSVLIRIKTHKKVLITKKAENVPNIELIETNDFIITFCFKLVNNNKLSNVIIDIMNYLDKNIYSELKIEDFIIIAICKGDKYTSNTVFTNGLIYAKYDMHNLINIDVNNPGIIVNPDMPTKFTVLYMLPEHNVYNVFLDVYTDIVFKSDNYNIDKDNCESWCKIPFNKYKNIFKV